MYMYQGVDQDEGQDTDRDLEEYQQYVEEVDQGSLNNSLLEESLSRHDGDEETSDMSMDNVTDDYMDSHRVTPEGQSWKLLTSSPQRPNQSLLSTPRSPRNTSSARSASSLERTTQLLSLHGIHPDDSLSSATGIEIPKYETNGNALHKLTNDEFEFLKADLLEMENYNIQLQVRCPEVFKENM